MPLFDRQIVSDPEGDAMGGVLNAFQGYKFDHGVRRPFLDSHDRPCVIVNTGRWTVEKGERVPIREKKRVIDLLRNGYVTQELLTANATSLRKEDWIHLDRQVLMSYRQRLRAWDDLVKANSTGGFNAMAKMTYEYEAMNDPGEAQVDMDGLSENRGSSPLFKLRSLPLPITHGGFSFSQRRLDVSGNSQPLSATSAESVARRIGETVEKTVIGTQTGLSYGYQSAGATAHDIAAPADGHGAVLDGSKVYGYTNFPHRLTKTNFTVPTGSNPEVTVTEVLAALKTLNDQFSYGPFMLYHSTDWTQWMDNDYARLGGSNANMTLRDRLRKIDGISDVRRLDFLTSTYTLLFVSMVSEVAEAINGMGITTVTWPSMGGLRQNFKIMCIQVPLLRSDYSGRTGILHGTTA